MLEGYSSPGTTNVTGVPLEPGADRDEYAAGGQLGWVAKGGKSGQWRTSTETSAAPPP